MFKTFSFVEFAQEIEGRKMNQSYSSSHLQKALGSLEPVRVPFDPRASLFHAKNNRKEQRYMKSEEGSKRSPYRLAKTPEFSVRNSFDTQGRARTTQVPGPRQLVKHPRLLTTIPRSRSVNDYQYDDIEEDLKKRQISIEDRIMELLIASKRQLKPKKKSQKRNPLVLETNKGFDLEIVENKSLKSASINNDKTTIPIQTIKGPKTLEEMKSHPLLTPGSIYRTRIGDRQILQIKLPTTV